MKTFGMSFGFNAVNSSQRNVNVEPQVIVVSTEGQFRITPAVSRALGVASGDYLMFFNNIANIDDAIKNEAPELKEYVESLEGVEWGTQEAVKAIHEAADMWVLAKGIAEYDSKGNARVCAERLSKVDKIKFATTNFAEMLATALSDADDETKEALSRDGITEQEQIEILSSFVVPREVQKYRGSKSANAAGMTGVGVSLNFTDTNVWNQLKSDMGENSTKFNRIYDVDVNNMISIKVFDGFKEVEVKGVLLGEYADKESSRIGSKSEE